MHFFVVMVGVVVMHFFVVMVGVVVMHFFVVVIGVVVMHFGCAELQGIDQLTKRHNLGLIGTGAV